MRRLLGRLRRLHAVTWVAAGVVLAALVAWPLGGWDTVELVSADPPDAAPGETVEGRRFAVALQEATIGTVHPDGYSEPEPGNAFVVLRLTAENRWVEPQYSWYLPDDMLVAETGGTVLEDADVVLASDGSLSPDLGPGVPVELLLVWELPAGSAGEELRVGIRDGVPRQDSEILSGTVWRELRVVAETRLPLVPEEAQ